MKRLCLVSSAVLALVAPALGAETTGQQPALSDGTAVDAASLPPGTIVLRRPPEQPTDLGPRVLRIKPMDRSRDSVGAGALKGIRLLSVKDGIARVLLKSGEQVVRAGDVIGADRVKRVEVHRIILERPAGVGELGPGKVIVTFNAQGLGRVQVLLQKEDTPPPVVAPQGN